MALNIFLPVLLALATNGAIFALGWTQPDHDIQPAWAPPGYVIGIVWTILFGLIGAARWQVRSDPRSKRLITILIAACLAYPFYTLGLQDNRIGLIGIVATAALAIFTILQTRPVSRNAAFLLLPLILWLGFAFALVIKVLQLNA